ncbi:MAG TPA: two-component regulator propeller domain-containing protein, partial [Pseudomonadota bacterium]|nr:two-component regulator propeller domain-containing protein [Pseudomonadota bacterium]
MLALSALDADRARRRRAATLPRLARCLLLAALLAMPAAHALPPARPLGEFSLDAWTTRDGLPHNLIHAIAQTPDGYLWFGTWEGLVRFNGREFKVFDRASVPELRDNGVRAIEVGRDGVLWLGTSRGGLVRYDGHAWENYGRDAGLPTLEVLGLLEDDRGRLWIGSENRGAIVREA